MNKQELKTVLVSLAVGILSGYIVLLLPLPGSPPKTKTQPHLMYVKHHEPAHARDPFLVMEG